MRLRLVRAGGVLAVTLVAVAGVAAAGGAKEVALPRDFRSWRHVRSVAVTDPEHAMYGFHDGYANDRALRGLRATPVRFEDGATFVVAIFDVVEQRGITTAGARRRTVVQVKDRSAVETGGWRFAAFDPAGQRIVIDPATCVGCHAQAKDRDLVFTSYRE